MNKGKFQITHEDCVSKAVGGKQDQIPSKYTQSSRLHLRLPMVYKEPNRICQHASIFIQPKQSLNLVTTLSLVKF